jgi:hypothetical protein
LFSFLSSPLSPLSWIDDYDFPSIPHEVLRSSTSRSPVAPASQWASKVRTWNPNPKDPRAPAWGGYFQMPSGSGYSKTFGIKEPPGPICWSESDSNSCRFRVSQNRVQGTSRWNEGTEKRISPRVIRKLFGFIFFLKGTSVSFCCNISPKRPKKYSNKTKTEYSVQNIPLFSLENWPNFEKKKKKKRKKGFGIFLATFWLWFSLVAFLKLVF